MENPTLFDNADIPDAAQKMVWDSLQLSITELKLTSSSTVFEAIISTLAKEAIQKKNVRAAEVLLKFVFRNQIPNKKDENTESEKADFDEWLRKIEIETTVIND
jgi:Na+-translocating ferredoxin:NAD+ oxidoreductase RnfG subunit